MGEEHLAVVLQRLRDEHRLDVEFAPARIPWRETITRSSRAQYKHKKQSGGAGQFAEVHLLLEPLKAQMPEPGDLTVRDEEEIDLAWEIGRASCRERVGEAGVREEGQGRMRSGDRV